MKPITKLPNILLMVLAFAATQLQAQQTPVQTAMTSNKAAREKAILVEEEFTPSDAVTLDGLKLRNEKLFRNFTKQFAGASDISIYPNAKTTVIYFMQGGVRNNTLFNNKGQLLHNVRYYDAVQLPQWVSEIVSGEFPDYEQKQVSEVSINGKTAYLVNIENARKIKIVRVVDNDWDVYKEFDKRP